ncbi:MAG: threonine/serine exporter family protein [Fusobacteriaceae bacterium]
MLYLLVKTISAGIASFFFGLIFNSQEKRLIFAGIAGAIGWFIYDYTKILGFSSTSSYFLASLGITFFAEISARKLKTPTTVIFIPALIPIVPGGGIYYTFSYFLKKEIFAALDKGLETIVVSGALAFGILFVSTIFKVFQKLKKIKKT